MNGSFLSPRLRLLIDESLAATVAQLLRDAGHDAVHLGDRGLLGARDEAVPKAAAKEGRVLVSADTDFGELFALGRHPGPSVLLLRRSSHVPAAQARLVLDALEQLETDLSAGAVATVSSGTVRVRRLPVTALLPVGPTAVANSENASHEQTV
jgi:predicted nuclease of predicted toxin-antitoxin system